MDKRARTSPRIGDLFGEPPVEPPRRVPSPDPIVLPVEPPELRAARVLSAEMRNKRTRRDKKQVAHLICLNLITMLKHGARR